MDPGFIYNNMISIGNGVGNEVQVNGVMITGGQGGTQNYFHNTIVLTNNVNTPALSSAFLRGENAAAAVNHPVVIQNNILYNNITSAGDHYAIRNFNTVPATNWTSNNNLLFSNGASGIGQWGTTNYNFADWQTNTSQDAQSKSKQVFFVNTATPDLHLTGSSIGDQDLAGTYLASHNIDFDGETRHNPPYMGLDEIAASPLPITLAGLNAKAINNDALLNWVSANESNSSHYEIEVSSNGRDFIYVDRVDAKGNSSISNSYKFTHINAREFVSEKGLVYYRLKMVDINQSFNYSKTVSVTFDKQSKATVSVYPNPVSDVFTVSVVNPSREEFSYTVTDMSGKVIAQKTGMVDGSATLQVDALKSLNGGIYFFSLIIGNETHQFKMIKK